MSVSPETETKYDAPIKQVEKTIKITDKAKEEERALE